MSRRLATVTSGIGIGLLCLWLVVALSRGTPVPWLSLILLLGLCESLFIAYALASEARAESMLPGAFLIVLANAFLPVLTSGHIVRESILEAAVTSSILDLGHVVQQDLPRLERIAQWPLAHILAVSTSQSTGLSVPLVAYLSPVAAFVGYCMLGGIIAGQVAGKRAGLMAIMALSTVGTLPRAVFSREGFAAMAAVLAIYSLLALNRHPTNANRTIFIIAGTSLILGHITLSVFFGLFPLLLSVAATAMVVTTLRTGPRRNPFALGITYVVGLLTYLAVVVAEFTGDLGRVFAGVIGGLVSEEASVVAYAYSNSPLETTFRNAVFIYSGLAAGLLVAVLGTLRLVRAWRARKNAEATLLFALLGMCAVGVVWLAASILVPAVSRIITFNRVYGLSFAFLALAAAIVLTRLKNGQIVGAVVLALLFAGNTALLPPTLYAADAVPLPTESHAIVMDSEFSSVAWATNHVSGPIVSDNKAIDLFNVHALEITANVNLTGGAHPKGAAVFAGNLDVFQQFDALYFRFETMRVLNGDGQHVQPSVVSPWVFSQYDRFGIRVYDTQSGTVFKPRGA